MLTLRVSRPKKKIPLDSANFPGNTQMFSECRVFPSGWITQAKQTSHSDGDKAEMLCDFFSKCFNHAVYHHFPQVIRLLTQVIPSLKNCYVLKIDEVHFFLTSLDTSKATGPDGISAYMLKSTASSITPSVTTLLNLSLRTGCLPKEWKRSSVVPIPKKSSATTPNNYRPISLLSIVSNVLERHVHTLIIDHLHNHHPLSCRVSVGI